MEVERSHEQEQEHPQAHKPANLAILDRKAVQQGRDDNPNQQESQGCLPQTVEPQRCVNGVRRGQKQVKRRVQDRPGIGLPVDMFRQEQGREVKAARLRPAHGERVGRHVRDMDNEQLEDGLEKPRDQQSRHPRNIRAEQADAKCPRQAEEGKEKKS